MSEQPEEQKLKRITIKTETGSKWFDEPEKLQSWVQQQRALYNFNSQASQASQRYQMHNLFSTFNNSWQNLEQLISNGLLRHKHAPEQYNQHAEQFSRSFEQFLNGKKLFTEDAPFAEFIKRQANKSVEKGLAAIAVAFDINVSAIDRMMFEGLNEADAYFAGNEERVNDETEALQQLKARWDDELTKHRDSWQQEYQLKIDAATIQNQKADGLISDWQDQTEIQTADLESHKAQFKESFDDELDKAKSDLENLTKTYDDKLALQASVKYWGIQHQSHAVKARHFAIALGISTVAVLAVIILFSILGLDKPFKEIPVSRLLTAAAITTFGIWIIKILANIFMSHLHLATDAQERRTMIHTYLALTRKGQGPREEDRQLILQTLFRPSTTDMIKNEQGPTQLVDLINRLSPRAPG
ncbi:MAG: DUF6161 domain-containing protein [Paraglaciecola sp.]|nr:DUF6161 domain-containing protein [Paraglaciecola sp.]